eukprot:TRINITY_DN189_c0_g2_i5.p2 TRINITY_DN189_c0_g2~~TRINITY_DN189_c0_g2_i5.p2  ORF type:complete len:197 (+),score=-1.71 TRINITY_DN189_c0_g2_i5:469-1059(+)
MPTKLKKKEFFKIFFRKIPTARAFVLFENLKIFISYQLKIPICIKQTNIKKKSIVSQSHQLFTKNTNQEQFWLCRQKKCQQNQKRKILLKKSDYQGFCLLQNLKIFVSYQLQQQFVSNCFLSNCNENSIKHFQKKLISLYLEIDFVSLVILHLKCTYKTQFAWLLQVHLRCKIAIKTVFKIQHKNITNHFDYFTFN